MMEDMHTTKPANAKVCTFHAASSFIRTMTVGSGITPDLLTFFWGYTEKALAGSFADLNLCKFTAGRGFHPALKTCAKK